LLKFKKFIAKEKYCITRLPMINLLMNGIFGNVCFLIE
jgi:hypothetical protein